jgi:hypothetical protein
MTEPILKDPRELYHTGKFADQDQDPPALQDKMLPMWRFKFSLAKNAMRKKSRII